MKPWRDLYAVPMPRRIAALPRDARGYPIPATVQRAAGDDRSVDFRVIDARKSILFAVHKRCALCGEPLGAWTAFVGGPRSIDGRMFSDAPAHRDCAIYALQVCPFLAAPSFGYRKSVPDDLIVNPAVSTVRPELFGLGVSRGFDVAVLGGSYVFRAKEWAEVEWWRHGQKIAHPLAQALE